MKRYVSFMKQKKLSEMCCGKVDNEEATQKDVLYYFDNRLC